MEYSALKKAFFSPEIPSATVCTARIYPRRRVFQMTQIIVYMCNHKTVGATLRGRPKTKSPEGSASLV